MKGVYKGFSSKRFQEDKNFVISDLDLVKEDLINHIFTRRGERVRMASFGTSIPDIMFQPLTSESVERVRTDLHIVFDYDPRVRLIELVVIPSYDESAIIALANLEYIELNLTDRLDLKIDIRA